MSEYNAEHQVRLVDARDKVIEAAKAFYEDKTMTAIEREAKLFKSVQALLAAENGAMRRQIESGKAAGLDMTVLEEAVKAAEGEG